MKKIILLLLILIFLAQIQAFAEKNTAVAKPTIQEKKTASLKLRVTNEIDRRINELNKLIARIDLIKKMDEKQKSTLQNQINLEITNLGETRTKIVAGTDQSAVKDAQEVVKSYNVYALYVPKIQIIVASDRMSLLAEQMTTLSGRLETKISSAKSEGKDVSALEPLLSDMKAKTTDASTQALNAENSVIPLTPAGFPANKNVLQGARTVLRVGHQDLVAAHKDAQEIVKGLKNLKPSKENSASSAAK